MSIQLVEILESRRLVDACNSKSASRRFMVYDNDGDADVSDFDAWRHAESNDLAIGDAYPGYSPFKLQELEIAASTERAKTWLLTASYAVGSPCESTVTLGPISQQVTARTEMRDVWRFNPNPNATPQGGVGGTAARGVDIGGNSAGPAGLPVSYLLPLLDLTINENTTTVPNHSKLASIIGTRNSVNFGGAAPGTVVYRGTNSNYNAVSGLYQVSHMFTADFHFRHQTQLAEGDDSTGGVLMASSDLANAGDGPEDPGYGMTLKGSASTVVWVQPFPRFYNHNDIPVYYPF